MKKLKRAYKIEIDPTAEQKSKIHQTIGVSRFIYNFYIAHNKEIYDREGKFVSGMDFSKWLNNEYIPNNKDMKWIKEVSSKATKQAIMNGDKSFRDFFKKAKGFPKFKKKKNQDVKAYFPKNNKTDWTIERHRVKIPTLGWIRLKEFGYIPVNSIVKSGTVSQKADRYYVSILVEENDKKVYKSTNEGVGIDLGIKEFVVCSDGIKFKNINKTSTVKKIEKKLKREQRKLSRKYESLKIRNKNIKEGRATRQNIQKQVVKVQKLHQRLTNIRTDYINKIVSSIIKQKPSYITIEDLNVKGMMKNKHLSKAIASQKFFEFKTKLTFKCKENHIELRIVDRFYPSSKTCSNCGEIKQDLKLSDRIYKCDCGLTIDRDLNSSINLKNAKEYKIA
ncbi:IS200/IS605 family element transposase accessory protein TnpB [Clostridium perfringens]|uniref:IS200/IS605 family element transposase accessory protein TnpB n=4 Tax=Clostridium perfringens TaxID=1502 RepID=A0AAW9K9G9_CLOPF|nr:RNA-guided endonuclease TnpB family protein [Clostridium perfringens]MBI6001829.1 IS200/IS605 family element transposase accessory protein TnpB [Clostridium perfringens]MBI6061294.1 IS200/IS605 family element transposase accessory protein TnpB [Clostridium perfringens]MBI6064368.1 IS200/IS605 family element transposase accessory protein TnpB [Clostridium perfringens]MBI6072787.1 IS200/IS605 family element transposase accessory protein TnpB [Clostridium perfringens]MBI6075838.1 IS200/IS605 f